MEHRKCAANLVKTNVKLKKKQGTDYYTERKTN